MNVRIIMSTILVSFPVMSVFKAQSLKSIVKVSSHHLQTLFYNMTLALSNKLT